MSLLISLWLISAFIVWLWIHGCLNIRGVSEQCFVILLAATWPITLFAKLWYTYYLRRTRTWQNRG